MLSGSWELEKAVFGRLSPHRRGFGPLFRRCGALLAGDVVDSLARQRPLPSGDVHVRVFVPASTALRFMQELQAIHGYRLLRPSTGNVHVLTRGGVKLSVFLVAIGLPTTLCWLSRPDQRRAFFALSVWRILQQHCVSSAEAGIHLLSPSVLLCLPQKWESPAPVLSNLLPHCGSVCCGTASPRVFFRRQPPFSATELFLAEQQAFWLEHRSELPTFLPAELWFLAWSLRLRVFSFLGKSPGCLGLASQPAGCDAVGLFRRRDAFRHPTVRRQDLLPLSLEATRRE